MTLVSLSLLSSTAPALPSKMLSITHNKLESLTLRGVKLQLFARQSDCVLPLSFILPIDWHQHKLMWSSLGYDLMEIASKRQQESWQVNSSPPFYLFWEPFAWCPYVFLIRWKLPSETFWSLSIQIGCCLTWLGFITLFLSLPLLALPLLTLVEDQIDRLDWNMVSSFNFH